MLAEVDVMMIIQLRVIMVAQKAEQLDRPTKVKNVVRIQSGDQNDTIVTNTDVFCQGNHESC